MHGLFGHGSCFVKSKANKHLGSGLSSSKTGGGYTIRDGNKLYHSYRSGHVFYVVLALCASLLMFFSIYNYGGFLFTVSTAIERNSKVLPCEKMEKSPTISGVDENDEAIGDVVIGVDPDKDDDASDGEENNNPEKDPDDTTDSETTSPVVNPQPNNTGGVVPQSDAVSMSYFDDAVFIGDSRTQGLQMYSGIKNGTFLALRGLSISTVSTYKFVDVTMGDHTETMTVTDALRLMKFGKVYISFGLNELGWQSNTIFAETYRDFIRKIKEINPSAIIYVENIIPMTKSASETSYASTGNAKIKVYNELIEKVCADEGVYYLDLASHFSDDEGNLDEARFETSTDGVHFKSAAYKEWANYLLTHTAEGMMKNTSVTSDTASE